MPRWLRTGPPVLVFLVGGVVSLLWGSLGALIAPQAVRPWLQRLLAQHPTLALAGFYTLLFGCCLSGLSAALLYGKMRNEAGGASPLHDSEPEGAALAGLVERVARLGEHYQESHFRELVGLILHLALRTTRDSGLGKQAFWYCRAGGPQHDDTFQTTLLGADEVDALAQAVGFLPFVRQALSRTGAQYYPYLNSQAHLRVAGEYTLPDCGSALVLPVHIAHGRRGVLCVYAPEEGRLGSARDRKALERLAGVLRVLYLLVPSAADSLAPAEGGRMGGAQR